MTIDITLLRPEKGGDPEVVRQSERRRFRNPAQVDKVIALDQEWIKAQFATEQKRKEVNAIKKDIGAIMKKGPKKTAEDEQTVEQLKAKKDAVEKEIEGLNTTSDELKERRDAELGMIGNLVHSSVPVSQDEDKDNEVISTWGTPRVFTAKYQTNGFRPHFELLQMIGAVQFEPGHDVAGHRGYFLTGPGVLLNQALINFGLAFLVKHGYTPVQPPFFMRKEIMGMAAELKDYDDVLYRVVESSENPDQDKYLIATSEQPLTAMHRNKTLNPEQLPMRMAGISSCFRKEAGSSGRDIRGIFRVHQFEKVEQFVICPADKSWEEHDRMKEMAEDYYQTLGLPYRVVNIVSGELNDAAAKKYDLEAWFPGDDDGKGKYRELVSCSNCLDFQARCVNTKAGFGKQEEFPHMLNSTLCATERAMCCVVENYQTDDGVKVPPALQPFMMGIEFLPFTQPAPKNK